MRKITKLMAKALKEGQTRKLSNTEVVLKNNWCYAMLLHWNEIAQFDRRCWQLILRHCNRKTATTKERLNWILDVFNLGHLSWGVDHKKRFFWWYEEVEGVSPRIIHRNWKDINTLERLGYVEVDTMRGY